MPSKHSGSWASILVFLVVLTGSCFTLYQFVRGPLIRADEVRVYRLLPSGKPTKQTLVHLHGDPAQDAANNFVFFTDVRNYECLDQDGWFRIVFLNKNKTAKTFTLYLPNGQIDTGSAPGGPPHLTKGSRLYWERLIQQHP